MWYRGTSIKLLAALFCSAFVNMAFAQSVIEEILVTAEKRETSLQDVALSITAITGDDLDRSNITSAVDLSNQVPGLVIAKNEGFRRVVTIRGMGYEANQNDIANPAVSFHIDGVYIADNLNLNADFLDVERIEVLRGPQGTVFGQNSAGGTIHLITKRPEIGEFSGKADVAFGTDNTFMPRAAVNIPISDTFAARAAVSYIKHDGYAEIVGTPLAGYELDEEDNITARVKLLWQPTENFSALFSAQYFDTSVHDRAQRHIGDTSSNKRELTQDFPGIFTYESEIYSATLEWDLPWGAIKSISSYQDSFNSQSLDNDRGVIAFEPLQDIVLSATKGDESYTQEINIVSSEDSALPFDWILGAFYLDQQASVTFLEFADFNQDGVIDETIDLENPFSNPDMAFETTSFPGRESWSVYAQATVPVADNFRITGGLRYTEDTVTSFVSNFFGVFGIGELRVDSDKLTGKAGLEWDWADNNMAYLTWTKGFKPGGTNLTFGSILVDQTFLEETVTAWEVGSKNQFADGRVQLNAAAFLYDYKNLQFMATDPLPFSGGVDNVPDVEIYGAEFELSAILTDNLRFDGSLAWLEGEIESDFIALDNVFVVGSFDVPFNLTQVQNLKGNTPPKLPKFAINLRFTHTYQISGHGTLTSRLQYSYRDDYQYRVFNNSDFDIVPSYDLWNLNFLYEPDNADWTIELIAENLADDDAVNSRFTNSFGVGHTSEELVSPRTILVRLGYKF